MNKLCCLIIMFFTCGACGGQNLVNNWSFEDTLACPDNLDQVNKSVGWSSFKYTPDYFNSCANPATYVSIPQNFSGYCFPKTGNAYTGFIAGPAFNYRECIGTQLVQPLAIGQKYFASFYVCRGGTPRKNAFNKIGIQLSTVQYSFSNPVPINNNSKIYTDSVITDTLNWTKISGSFIADSTYQYLIIGVFFDDSLVTFINIDSLQTGQGYYYLDDVKLSPDSMFVNSVNEHNNNIEVQVFPNPFTDKLTITTKTNEQLQITLYDITSRKLLQQSFTTSTSINTVQLSKGIYLYEVKNKNGIIRQGKIVKD